jgi:NADPH2:quinone reductase
MRAIEVAAAGSADQLRLVDAPEPTAGPGEILVRVGYAGVNFADTMLRRDAYFAPATFPFIPGVEVGGRVMAVGSGVDGWAPGERVAGVRLDGGGGYAEVVRLEARCAAKVPEGLDMRLAVAVLNQGLTAQGLIEAAPEIANGASVLVTAAGGGVGGLLLQLARLGGAGQIIGAASDPAKIRLAEAVNAVALDYNDPAWGRAVRAASGGRGVEVFIDGIGGAIREAAPRMVAVGGRIVFYGAASGTSGVTEACLAQVMGKNQSLTGFSVFARINGDPAWLPATLARLFALALAGTLTTPLHPPIPLERAAYAHAAIEGRRTWGKLLLEIAPEEDTP